MAIDVEELVIQPFREVVERGKEAVANAEAASAEDEDDNSTVPSDGQNVADMLRTARALVREGERALQRLLPLWKERVEKYGDAFTETMRQNDRILDSQRRLEDLLYDLDDFVQVDSFDATKFAEVQGASKSFALTLMETIRRLHIEESTPSLSSVPSWIQPLPSRAANSNSHSNTGSTTASGINENVGIGGARTPARRPSSPDILGAERDCISLVSGPANGQPSSSRISAWISEQTAAKLWPHTNSIPEDDYFSGQPTIYNNLDSVALHGQETPVPSAPANGPYSPETSYSRLSWYTTTGSYTSGPRSSIQIPTSDQRTTSLGRPMPSGFWEHRASKLLEPPPLPSAAPVYEDGLIPAEELFERQANSSSGYQMGLESSLYIQKGLCPGAQTYRVKGRKSATKTVMEYGTRRSLARCTECEFTQKLLDTELDAAQDPSANFTKAGVMYRLRFLYKSHLISTTAFTMQLGCLFCVEKGKTVYADDATVFSTQEQLFKHLSRHPQPLPDIPGVMVLYGDVYRDNPNAEDYDLHFPNPPVASILPDAAYLAKFPSAVAVKSHVKKYGRDLTDPDGNSDQVLKFLEGARIVGIEFPERWKGKWCTGWHDGQWGAFVAKLVMLEPPARPPGISTSADSMFVTTRWKWDIKNTSDGWLPFDKDETLSNVTWLNQDDWCWSGTKKNGKAGLFPRSHIILDSLRESAVWHEEGEEEDMPKAKKQNSFGLSSIKMRRMTIGSSTS
ncbi:hypothetical protein F4804DRAFT_344035 [Jackrogersella minutella]|nr:hypothetical protein F4804DRAFT_344035 [Jackrogersella minutella]